MRTHLRLVVQNFANVADEFIFGFIVARDTDIGVKPVTLNPNVETELDWMLLRDVRPTSSGATVDAFREVDIDLKSRRKMHQLGQRFAFVGFNNSAVNPLTVDIYGRVLFALP